MHSLPSMIVVVSVGEVYSAGEEVGMPMARVDSTAVTRRDIAEGIAVG